MRGLDALPALEELARERREGVGAALGPFTADNFAARGACPMVEGDEEAADWLNYDALLIPAGLLPESEAPRVEVWQSVKAWLYLERHRAVRCHRG